MQAATREEWLAERSESVGASESACLFGAHPYLSPLALYYRKRGLAEGPLENEEAAQWGLLLEEPIAKEYARRTGRKVVRHEEHVSLLSSDAPWMSATPDFFQYEEGRPGLLQVKTCSAWKEAEWDDGVPLGYQIQVQHEMFVTGRAWATLAVLFGGQRLHWFDMDRNEPFMAVLSEKCRKFMECVRTGERPEVDGSEATTKALKALNPRDSGATIVLPEAADDWTATIEEAEETIRAAQGLRDIQRNRLRAAMGEAAIGETPGGTIWTYKADKNGKRSLKRRGE